MSTTMTKIGAACSDLARERGVPGGEGDVSNRRQRISQDTSNLGWSWITSFYPHPHAGVTVDPVAETLS